MSERNKHIDDLFRDALGDYTETPPPAVWDALEQRLNDDDGGQGGGAGGNNNKPVFPYRWLWYIGALLLLVAAGVTVWSVSGPKVDKVEVVPASVQQPAGQSVNDAQDAAEDNIADDANNILPQDVGEEENNDQLSNDNTNTNTNTSTNNNTHTSDGRSDDRGNDNRTDNPTNNSNKNGGSAKNSSGKGTRSNNNTSSSVSKSNTKSATINNSSNTNQQSSTTNTTEKSAPEKVKQTSVKKTQDKQPSADAKAQAPVSQTQTQANTSQVADGQSQADNKANDQQAQAVNKTGAPKTDDKQDAIAATKDPATSQKAASKDPKQVKQDLPKTQDKQPDAVAKADPIAPKADEGKVKPTPTKPTQATADVPKTQDKQPDAVAKADPIAPKADEGKVKPTPTEPTKATPDVPKTQDKQPAKVDKKANDIVTPDDNTAKKGAKNDADNNAMPKQDAPAKNDDKKQQDDNAAVANNKQDNKAKTTTPPQRKQGDLSAPPVTVDSDEEELSALDSAEIDAFNNGGDLTHNGSYKDPAKHKRSKKRHVAKDDNKKAPRKIEGGINLGYEFGFDNNRADKYLVAPFVQYNLSSKSSLLFQPAYLMGMVKLSGVSGTTDQFYNIVSASMYDSSVVYLPGDSTQQLPDTVTATYRYRNQYDSIIIKSNVTTKQLWDVELPLIYQYKISRNFSVFGGVSLTVSKSMSYTDTREDYKGFSDSLSTTWTTTYPNNTQPPTPPAGADPNTLFSYNGKPFSSYVPGGSNSTTNTFTRFGYMFGFNATINDRFLIGASYQQKGVNTKVIANPQLQKIYNQPYIRLTVGYKLFK